MTDFSPLDSALYESTPEKIAASLRYLRKADAVMAALMPLSASTPASPARDETPIDLGGESVPRWVFEYAGALTTYHAERGGGAWAISGVQSRDQAPRTAVPAGYVPVPVEPTQAMLDAAGMCIIPDGKEWLDQSNREVWAAMLAAAERKGEE